MSDRTPPHDVEAEQATLGAMLMSKAAIDEACEIVAGEDFYRPVHQTVFGAIVRLHERGEPADARMVTAELFNTGELQRVGGAPYLQSMLDAVPLAANVGYYARIVQQRAVSRRLVEAGVRITQLGYGSANSEGVDLSDVVDLAQRAVFDISADRNVIAAARLEDMLRPTLDGIEAAAGKGDEMTGVPTGFKDLDRLLNGLQPGQVVIVAGRPGLGKSTVGLDIARHAAIRAGLPSAFFTLEMSKVEMVTRLLSAEARVPMHVLRSGQLSDDDWTRLARRMGEISEAPIFVDDTPNMSLGEIRAKARTLKKREGLRLLVVDYLQLMTSPKRSESRQQEVSDLSRNLKLLAKELECPIIAVSQLNRGPEQRTDKRPQLSDLRESGSIEQDADVVILLHRDDYYDKESVRAGEADLIVAKHRNGATDTITVASQLHFSRFVDMAAA